MKNEARQRLLDVLEACRAVERFARGRRDRMGRGGEQTADSVPPSGEVFEVTIDGLGLGKKI